MFFVLCLHVCTQSGIADAPVSIPDDIIFKALSEPGRTACSTFVMASAWLLSSSSFKVERIVMTWIKTLAYILIVYFLFYHAYELPLSDFFPIGGGMLWFVSAYLCMLLFSPLMNAALSTCPKDLLKWTLLFTGIPMLVYPTLMLKDGFLGNYVVWFIWIYLLMGYLKRYPVKLFENKTLMITGFLVLMGLRLFPRIEVRWSGRIPFFENLIPVLDWYSAVLWTIPNFLTALCLFYIFADIKIKPNRLIAFFGKHTLAVYILHQMPFFYDFLWNGIFQSRNHAGTAGEIPYMILVILCVFTAASLIDRFFDLLIFDRIRSLLEEPFKRINSRFLRE